MYKSFGDNLRQQDEILTFIVNESPVALLKQEDFRKTGIDLETARQLVYVNDFLEKALFGRFQLVHQKNGFYKIITV